MKLMKNTLSKVSKIIAIAIGDLKTTIAIGIGDLFSNGDRDRNRDLKFDQDRDRERERDRNFRDRVHALSVGHLSKLVKNPVTWKPQQTFSERKSLYHIFPTCSDYLNIMAQNCQFQIWDECPFSLKRTYDKNFSKRPAILWPVGNKTNILCSIIDSIQA